jgi:hypothetical protein
MTRLVRQIRMTDQRPLCRLAKGFRRVQGVHGARGAHGVGVVGAFGGLLVAALAGCGSVVASAPAAAPAAAAAAATPQVGCASVNQATSVTIRRAAHLVEPQPDHSLSATYYSQSKVRALFGQMCAAVTHPAPRGVYHCPADFGTSYAGAFYDGSRVLALFTYAPTGCQDVSVTAADKTMTTLVAGPAAAAAPHLAADLQAIVGGTAVSPGAVNPGGPDKPPT